MLFQSLSSSMILTFPFQKQYPLKPKVKEELKPTNENLKEQGLLIPYNSPCNSPILGVKKLNDKDLFKI